MSPAEAMSALIEGAPSICRWRWPMRHATVWAIQCLSNHQDTSFPSNIQACDWTKSTLTGDVRAFGEESADDLKMGLEPEDPLPTCPACALFVDLACIEAGLTGGENVEATVSS